MDNKKALLIAGGTILVVGVGSYLYQQYKLSDLLCYSADGFEVKKLGLNSSTVEIQVKLQNKGELDLKLRKMDFDIYANGVFLANVNQSILAPIKPHNSVTFPISVAFSPKSIIKNLKTIVSSSSLDDIVWKFKGKIVVEKWGIPFPLPVKLDYTTKELRTPSADSVC